MIHSEDYICHECGLYLYNPTTLPCGHSVCSKHFIFTPGLFICETCHQPHQVPLGGYGPNKLLNDVIKSNQHLSGRHKLVKRMTDNFDRYIDSMKQNPAISSRCYFISSYFENLRNQADSHRIKEIKYINRSFEEIVKKLNEMEKECVANRQHVETIDLDCFELNDELVGTLRDPNIDNIKLNDIFDCLDEKINALRLAITAYESNLIMNRSVFFQKPTHNVKFGDLVVVSNKVLYYKNGFYVGEFSGDNKRDGRGIFYYSNGDRYVGEWKDDKKNGYGRENYLKTCNRYEGVFFNDKRTEKGKFVTSKKVTLIDILENEI